MNDQLQISNNIDQSLRFAATKVYVDNYTDRWLYFPAANRFAPPSRAGLLYRLPGTRKAQVQFQQPSQPPYPHYSGSQVAILTFADDED